MFGRSLTSPSKVGTAGGSEGVALETKQDNTQTDEPPTDGGCQTIEHLSRMG